jgi:nucleoside phosphorylase
MESFLIHDLFYNFLLFYLFYIKGQLMIICAGDSENFNYATSIGVGLINSASTLTQICLEQKPKNLLFVGSAGSYTRDIKIFDIFTSSSASNIENSFLNDSSFTPLENLIKIEDSFVEDNVLVNSSNYITKDFEIAKKYHQYKIYLENMEFFAVLKIAQKFEIPVGGAFVVTNYCDKDAHQDFIKNHKASKEILTEYLYKNGYIIKENN